MMIDCLSLTSAAGAMTMRTNARRSHLNFEHLAERFTDKMDNPTQSHISFGKWLKPGVSCFHGLLDSTSI